jgi:uncharacterized membrane protein
MTKLEFMKELESLLLDIPLEEREEALKYYNGYFEDAGEDQEDKIIEELGSPKQVADMIKADLVSSAAEYAQKGIFTENGYQETANSKAQFVVADPKTMDTDQKAQESASGQGTPRYTGRNTYQSAGRSTGQSTGQDTGNYNQTKQTKNNDKIALIILLCIFAIPVGIPLLSAAFGIAVGLIGALFGLIVGFGAAGIAMIFGGIALLISGLVQLSMPLIGFAMVGSGLIVLGLGMLFTMVSSAICTKLLPALCRGIVNLCRLPFKNRSVMA